MRRFETSEPRYMVAHASASQKVAPPGHSPSHGSSQASGAMDEKETEEKPASKHIRSNEAHERAWEKISIEPDSPTMDACPLNAESRPPRCARGAPAPGNPTSFPSAASAPSPITARSPCASKSSPANTPCATQSLPPGANTRANSANATGNDHARFKTLLIYTKSIDASSMQAWERFSGIAGEKRR